MNKWLQDPDSPVEEPGQRRAGGDYVPMTVEQFDNHVYFYAGVNTDRCLDLIKKIREIDNELRRERLSRMLPDDYPDIPIWLHIQSGGGSMMAGFGMADQLVAIQSPIYSVVEGLCCSAATLIALAARRRFITASSFILIHQFSSIFWGTHEEFKDEMHLQEMAMKRLHQFYAAKTKLTVPESKKLLMRDSWFDARGALEHGFVEAIL